MTIYEYDDYKKYLRDGIELANQRGTVSAFAKAIGCTHSYFSQVLHGKPELTPDQAMAAAGYLRLKDAEEEYFLTLVLSSRASTPRLKQHLAKKLEKLRVRHLSLSRVVRSAAPSVFSQEDRDTYYSSWLPQAIHILTACHRFQRPEDLSARLSVSLKEVKSTLRFLRDKGLVREQKGAFVHSGENIHLPTESIHNQVNHMHWRNRGVVTYRDSSAVHYTSLFAISAKDYDFLKAKILKFIDEQRADIGRSGCEEGVVFCCDYFRV